MTYCGNGEHSGCLNSGWRSFNFKEVFDDAYACCTVPVVRTKTTAIVKYALAPTMNDEVVKCCRTCFFFTLLCFHSIVSTLLYFMKYLQVKIEHYITGTKLNKAVCKHFARSNTVTICTFVPIFRDF